MSQLCTWCGTEFEPQGTARTDNLTRGKMDALMEEMNQEIEERLAHVPTMH